MSALAASPAGGMSLKQFAEQHFFTLLDAYREAKKHLDAPGSKAAFVGLSVQLHAAKGGVHKRYWPLFNRAFREPV
jgi:hypothetical protein